MEAVMSDTALVIIDVQSGLLKDQDYPPFDGDGLVQRLGGVIEKARGAGIPVIYVQHRGGEGDSLHPSLPGFAIDERIAPKPGEVVVQKSHPDAFQDTPLQSELESRGIKKLVIGGMETPMCVDTSTRRAYSLGYDVTLIADGHSTAQYADLTVPQIIAHHNGALSAFASVKPAADIAFETAQSEQASGLNGSGIL
jgi:nicotinamidase-related amidase